MITARVVGADEVSRKLTAFPGRAQHDIRSAMGKIVARLVRGVKESRLTGQSLHVRTGRLRRSIHGEIDSAETSVTGIVGTNVKYAAAHEYGFTGTENVKAHLRKLKGTTRQRMKKTNVMGLRGVTTVESFGRHMNIPERSFLRAELAEQHSQITQDLNAAVDAAIKKWNH